MNAQLPLWTVTSTQDIDARWAQLADAFKKHFQYAPKKRAKGRDLVCELAGMPGGYQQFLGRERNTRPDDDPALIRQCLAFFGDTCSELIYSHDKQALEAFAEGVNRVNDSSIGVETSFISHPQYGYLAGLCDDDAVNISTVDDLSFTSLDVYLPTLRVVIPIEQVNPPAPQNEVFEPQSLVKEVAELNQRGYGSKRDLTHLTSPDGFRQAQALFISGSGYRTLAERLWHDSEMYTLSCATTDLMTTGLLIEHIKGFKLLLRDPVLSACAQTQLGHLNTWYLEHTSRLHRELDDLLDIRDNENNETMHEDQDEAITDCRRAINIMNTL
jgi:hypothetical protein